MQERQVVISNLNGMHARPAAVLVREAMKHSADITLEKEGHLENGKSLLGLLMLAADHGATITLRVNGSDEIRTADSLHALMSNVL